MALPLNRLSQVQAAHPDVVLPPVCAQKGASSFWNRAHGHFAYPAATPRNGSPMHFQNLSESDAHTCQTVTQWRLHAKAARPIPDSPDSAFLTLGDDQASLPPFSAHTYLYIYTYISLSLSLCIGVYYIYIYVCIDLNMCMHMSIYIYIYSLHEHTCYIILHVICLLICCLYAYTRVRKHNWPPPALHSESPKVSCQRAVEVRETKKPNRTGFRV